MNVSSILRRTRMQAEVGRKTNTDRVIVALILCMGSLVFALGCAPSPRMVDSMEGGPMSRGMMRMMGMADMANALNNVDKYMPQGMAKIERIAMDEQRKTVARGKKIFNDTEMGSSGLSCNSCHPGGGTTGGMVPLPMRAQYKLRIPDLHGAAATFPKFKVPSGGVISLEKMNTNCVRMFVLGDFPSDSDSGALAAYVTTLSHGETMGMNSK